MRGVTARFVMLIATAAVAPLVVYGVVSILRLESGTKQSVTEGNARVAGVPTGPGGVLLARSIEGREINFQAKYQF